MGWSFRSLKRRKITVPRSRDECDDLQPSWRLSKEAFFQKRKLCCDSWCNCTVWWGQYSTFINNAILKISHKHDSMITMHSTSPWAGHLPMAPWLRPWGRWGCQWKPNSWKASNSLARKLSERFKYLPNKGVHPFNQQKSDDTIIFWNHAAPEDHTSKGNQFTLESCRNPDANPIETWKYSLEIRLR